MKQYEKPEFEIILLETGDVITSSLGADNEFEDI